MGKNIQYFRTMCGNPSSWVSFAQAAQAYGWDLTNDGPTGWSLRDVLRAAYEAATPEMRTRAVVFAASQEVASHRRRWPDAPAEVCRLLDRLSAWRGAIGEITSLRDAARAYQPYLIPSRDDAEQRRRAMWMAIGEFASAAASAEVDAEQAFFAVTMAARSSALAADAEGADAEATARAYADVAWIDLLHICRLLDAA